MLLFIAMNAYLATKSNVPPGYGHPTFGVAHILTLVFTVVFIALFSSFYMRRDEKVRKTIRIAVAVFLLLDEVLKHANAIITGQWEAYLLPLHLCSVNIFIIVLDAFHSTESKENYLVAVCIPASIMALIFPSWIESLPYFGLMSIHSWTVHIALLLYPCLLLASGFNPSLKKFFKAKVVIPFSLLLAFVFFFNRTFGTDFFFLSEGGEGNPLSFFESIMHPIAYALFVVFLLYLMATVTILLVNAIKKRVDGNFS